MNPTAQDILAVVAEEKVRRIDQKISHAIRTFADTLDEERAMAVRDALYEE